MKHYAYTPGNISIFKGKFFDQVKCIHLKLGHLIVSKDKNSMLSSIHVAKEILSVQVELLNK